MSNHRAWSAAELPTQGLGLMRMRAVEPGADPDREPAAVIHAAVDAGVTLMDTAEMYGNEELVGQAIAERRDEIVLCSKFGIVWGASGRHDDWSVQADPAAVRRSCEDSLRRLDVEVIDLYYLHMRSDTTPIEETMAALADLVQTGKIRAIGLSNVTAEDLRRAHAVHPVSALQEQWSLLSRTVEDELAPTAAELGVALIAHSPLGHGVLPERDHELGERLGAIARERGVQPAQIALAWVHEQGRRRGQPVVPIPGTTSVRRVQANAAAAHLRLDDAELARLDTSSSGATPSPS